MLFMAFGILFINILILATVLKFSLQLIAEHEADTGFPKAAMVTAGILVANLIMVFLTTRFGPFVMYPAQFLVIAGMIMYFCWTSFWKSALTAMIFSFCFFLLVFVEAIAAAAILAATMTASGMAGNNAAVKPVTPVTRPQLIQPTNAYSPANPAALVAEANRLKAKSEEKRAEVERRVREMEQDMPPSQSTAPARIPPPVQPVATQPVHQPATQPAAQPRLATPPANATVAATAGMDWAAAKLTLKIGGTMSSKDGFVGMINGKPVAAGNIVSTTYKGALFRWRVKSISRDGMDLEPVVP